MTGAGRDDLNPLAVAKANQQLWASHPELRGRSLTMAPEDAAYRAEWMRDYHAAVRQTLPPQPAHLPMPVPLPPPRSGSDPVQMCPLVAGMTHQQKMEAAIERAHLTPAVREALGDIKTLVAQMVIVGGILAGLAATGYGAVAEAVGAGLLVLGAALSGVQIGNGITHLMDFVHQTQCDVAKTPEDLDKAGKSFADGIASIGVGGLNLLISLVGARGKSPTGKPMEPSKAPLPEPVPDRPPASSAAASRRGQRIPPRAPQPEVRPARFTRTSEAWEALATDPDHAGVPSPKALQERNVAIGLENRGDVPGPVVRDTTPGRGDFVDPTGQVWDVKGPSSRPPPGTKGAFDAAEQAGKVDKSLAKSENVMLDTTDMAQADIDALKLQGASRGWGDRVKWWP